MGWEVVDEVEPITLLHPNPWELLLRVAYIAMLCYARRRGSGLSEIHDRCEVINYWFNLRWQLKLTFGWIEAPREPSVVCFFGNPGEPV